MIVSADESWMEQSVPVEDAEIQLYFLTQQTFLTGDPNNPAHFDDPRYNAPIPSAFPDGYAELARFEANQAQLITYYREVVELAGDRPFDHWRQYVWMRMAITWGESDAIGFPWYDTWSEMERFVQFLETDGEDDRFDDIDEGWDVLAIRKGGHFYLRMTDGYPDWEVLANVRLPAAYLADLAKAVRIKAEDAIQTLTNALGADVWTRYVYNDESIMFGTSDWHPGDAQ